MTLAAWQEQELTNGGDSRLHYPLADRTPTHDTILGIQSSTNVQTKTGNYTPTEQDDILLVDTTSASVTITLPTAKAGREYEIVKTVNANALTIVPTGSDTVVGTTSVIIYTQWTALRFKAVTGGWVLI